MDINIVMSVMLLISSLFSILCYFPNPGKFLFPKLHEENSNKFQKNAIFLQVFLEFVFQF